MSTFNFWMIALGLLIAKADILRRVYSSGTQKPSTAAQLIAILDFNVPFALMAVALLFDRVFEHDRISDDRYISDVLSVVAFLTSLAACPIGGFALVVLYVKGSMGRNGWQQPATRRTLALACLDVAHPVLLTGFAVSLTILAHFIGKVFSG